MKKSLKSIVSKFSLTATALILTQSLSFGAEKVPEVYVSEAPFSNISGQQLLNTTWFWVLIIVVVLVFVTAYFATGTTNKTGEPHAL
jgi:hypothetical protein